MQEKRTTTTQKPGEQEKKFHKRDEGTDITVSCVWGHAQSGLVERGIVAWYNKEVLFGPMDGSPLISPWCCLMVLGYLDIRLEGLRWW